MDHGADSTSRYDRLFALIHQAARQEHLHARRKDELPPPHAIMQLRDAAERSLGRAPADESLRRALRP
ncbi:hypothetical protein PGB28_11195 [Primorskyibacter aestuariivivens]|uniref:hypothetical protein n=1 Tax=Primorskyibacter aestuariivivens TaxID=1888912 RepID=UPI0023016553|nr:hypothetical protein [Primorskyibacter aestuariivivens]MDA7429023.1 hypothetical protein [Primorskyibacter aestuariivivens]